MTHQFRIFHRDPLGLFYRDSLSTLQDLLSFEELVVLLLESSSFQELRSKASGISVLLFAEKAVVDLLLDLLFQGILGKLGPAETVVGLLQQVRVTFTPLIRFT